MDQPYRQALSAAAFQVDIELAGEHFARCAGEGRQQRRAVAGDEIGQVQAAGADLCEIVVQPVRQRRIHIGNGAARLGGEKARWRMIEEVDCVLQFLKDVLVAVAFAGYVRYRPEGGALVSEAFQRAHADAVPAHLAIAGQRRRQAKLLGAALALAGRLREAVDRL